MIFLRYEVDEESAPRHKIALLLAFVAGEINPTGLTGLLRTPYSDRRRKTVHPAVPFRGDRVPGQEGGRGDARIQCGQDAATDLRRVDGTGRGRSGDRRRRRQPRRRRSAWPGPRRVPVPHPSGNLGYGANQKTCYALALEQGADIVVMVHPDYQYTPKLIPAMVAMHRQRTIRLRTGLEHPRRIRARGGMPWWKYIANRFLTVRRELLTGAKLSEYHTGYRAFSRDCSSSLAPRANSNDFVFDNQMLLRSSGSGHTIAEITCPTHYFPEASSINLIRSIKYGLGAWPLR